MKKVIAVERGKNIEPAEGILIDDKEPCKVIRWWGGYAWEDLLPEEANFVFDSQSPHRPFEIELPDDWEEGYLVVKEGKVEFIYGKQPKTKLKEE